MTLDDVLDVLTSIKGCTFASLDTRTEPSPGLYKETTGEQVMLFTNQHLSGYEQMIRRRLLSLGKDPDGFVLGPLPFGERIPGSPLIKYENVKGVTYYLQTIILNDGKVRAFIGATEVDPSEMPDIFLRDKDRFKTAQGQGLPAEKAVTVRTYKLENIKKINVLGETLIEA